jgi:NAD(P)-dependent dehydrogenase (short-subunit alcohol dehydrogenase family)
MYIDDLLEGQVILVTGGGTGLGRSMSRRFAELGARVALCGRRREVAEATAREITETTGGEALGLGCDVRDYEAVESFVDAAAQRFGKVTGLVNNAAGNFLAQTEKLSPNGFRTVVDIVLQGSFHATLAFGRRVIRQAAEGAENRGGTVLSIVTTYAWTGSAFVVPSAAAKAGVLAMTRSLAVEWARHGIRLNAIAPGPFPTEGAFSRLLPPEVLEGAKRRIPLGRFGEHEELENLAVYLMSDRSAFVNGEVVVIDGGEWLSGGEFNDLTRWPPEKIDRAFEELRETTRSK